MTTLGREDLDDQAVRGLVNRIAVEQLVGDRPCLVGPAKLKGAPPRHDRHALPSGLQPLSRRGQPVLVDVVREELARPQLEDHVDRPLDLAVAQSRRRGKQVEGGTKAVQVQVQTSGVERDPAGLRRQHRRVTQRPTGEMERLAQVGPTCLGLGARPQGLSRRLAERAWPGVTRRSFMRRSAETRCQSARETRRPAAITSNPPSTRASILPEMPRGASRGQGDVPTIAEAWPIQAADARAEWTVETARLGRRMAPARQALAAISSGSQNQRTDDSACATGAAPRDGAPGRRLRCAG